MAEWILFLVLVGIVFFALRYTKRGAPPPENRTPSESQTQQRPAVAAPPAQDDDGDTYEYEIVGESNYQQQLLQLFGPKTEHGVDTHCAAVLRLEPENKYDKNAVCCEISGLKVGYLSRDDAKDFRKHMRRLKTDAMPVTANVRGGWSRPGSEGSFGVRIEVPAETID